MGLLIASRQSDLARLQAYQVGDALQAHNSNLKINYHFRESLGDINQDDPLWKMPEKGVFTQDFRAGLLQGQFDMVVHSWKDLPVEQEEGTEIVATLPRADMRDLLLFKKSHRQKVADSQRLQLFSSSPRRIYNLSRFFKAHFPEKLDEVVFESVRGNILTRVRKLVENPEIDGLIVAKAAIDRLLSVTREEFLKGQKELQDHLKLCDWQVLPLSENPTAAAQGALAVEIKSDRKDLKELLLSVHCQDTWDSVVKERVTLKSHGGGCHQKIGVSHLNRPYGNLHFVKGETEAGEVLDQVMEKEPELNLGKTLSFKTQWFDRESVEYNIPSLVTAHYVARANALPENEKLADQLVWTSGLKTWQKLASRGVWVHGSSESLGEKEDKRLQVLAPNSVWARWTHEQGVVSEGVPIATYKLIAKEQVPQTEGVNDFFWMSGSQFKRAIEVDPKILEANHYCGPGHTFEIISQELKNRGIKKVIKILPNVETWRKATKG